MSSSSNDNRFVPALTPGQDPHGQAAILLVESLIHALIAGSVITVANAVEVVEVAIDVSKNMREELSEGSDTIQRSILLLESISRSLSGDLAE